MTFSALYGSFGCIKSLLVVTMIEVYTAQESQGCPLVDLTLIELLAKQIDTCLQVINNLFVTLSHRTALRHIVLIHHISYDAGTQRGTIVIGIGITIELGQIEKRHTTEGKCLTLIVVHGLLVGIRNLNFINIGQNHITVLNNTVWISPIRRRHIALGKAIKVSGCSTLSRADSLHIVASHVAIIHQSTRIGVRRLHSAIYTVQSGVNLRL